jgi:hypothetical protein
MGMVKEETFDLEIWTLDLYDERITRQFHALFLHDVKNKVVKLKELFAAKPRTKPYEHRRSSLLLSVSTVFLAYYVTLFDDS